MKKSQSRLVLLVYGSSAEHWTSIVQERCCNVETVTLEQCRSGTASFKEVTGLIGWRFPPDIFHQMPNLRWIQFISAGIDEWTENSRVFPHIVVTNTKGLYSDSVADYIIWSMLTLTRKFDVLVRNQSKRRWRQLSGPSLKGKTIGILGMGKVGCAVASRAAAFELKTVGIVLAKTTIEQDEIVHDVVPYRDLHLAIGEFDVLAVCVPLTDVTRGLIDAEMIARMKPKSYLINTSRAAIVDELAAVRALQSSQLAGVALDVFEREPIRPWSSLWKTKNLIITPHISGLTDDYRKRVGDLICENIGRFSTGESLLNVVDLKKGY